MLPWDLCRAPRSDGSPLLQDYVLVVPEDAYNPSYHQEEPLDKSYEFISRCAGPGYHIR